MAAVDESRRGLLLSRPPDTLGWAKTTSRCGVHREGAEDMEFKGLRDAEDRGIHHAPSSSVPSASIPG
jgi:hypothetical protein